MPILSIPNMDAESSTIASPQHETGPLWLEKVNVDTVFSIVAWLDPLSTLSLSCVCKSFQKTIGCDYHTWHRALQQVATEHCISPHSLDDLSINNLKLLSTRPLRLIRRLRAPRGSLRANAIECVLGYGPLLPPPSSHDSESIPKLEYLAAELFPGGRWIISGVMDHNNRSTSVCCWDRSNFHAENTPLQPVATFVWAGWRPYSTWRWAQAQLEGPDYQEVSYEILRLNWSTQTSAPVIKSVARLAHDDYRAFESRFSQYHLEGPCLILENIGSIFLWDWNQNLIGCIDVQWIRLLNGCTSSTHLHFPLQNGAYNCG
ncbi:hypothetical protein DL93DRAFT_1982375 [Clavulina sp. PMI_390]|nr:hypothetical protein DL93DRAFT_1982375 [Clavulina sp. PMI_390]